MHILNEVLTYSIPHEWGFRGPCPPPVTMPFLMIGCGISQGVLCQEFPLDRGSHFRLQGCGLGCHCHGVSAAAARLGRGGRVLLSPQGGGGVAGCSSPSLPSYSDAADLVVQGKGTFEELMVCSREIAASTAQLVAASKVGTSRCSPAVVCTCSGVQKPPVSWGPACPRVKGGGMALT